MTIVQSPVERPQEQTPSRREQEPRPVAGWDEQIAQTRAWMESPRFTGIKRLYAARQVVEQRGTIAATYQVAKDAAEAFYRRLRELFEARKSITTFGPYSPGQAVAMKRIGIEGIYLGGWATSAKGSTDEDPGPDLASYPLSQVPDEAAVIVRALLTADRNQRFWDLAVIRPHARAETGRKHHGAVRHHRFARPCRHCPNRNIITHPVRAHGRHTKP